jgi:putative two-component system response regulator
MAIIAEFRDTETGGHILRTKEYMRALAETLSVPGSGFVFEDLELLTESATLHDIGKVGIPDAVLRKPGPLTAAEFAVIKTHPAIGWRIVERTVAMTGANVLLRYAGEIARSHHEKYDGSGYPDGLVGDQIPASAQLMALADVYDALVSHRVYKAAGSHEDAMRVILEGDGRVMPDHFNPKVLDAFVHSAQRFSDIALRFAG